MKTERKAIYNRIGLLMAAVILAASSLAFAQPNPSEKVVLDQIRVDASKPISVELARKAAQSHIDSVAKDFPATFKDSKVTGDPTLCYDLDGNASSYLFDVCKEDTAVGFVLAGADPNGPSIYLSSGGISPKEKRRIAYQSWGKTDANLRVDITQGRAKILYIGGLNFYLAPSESESKARGTQYIQLSDYKNVSFDAMRNLHIGRMAGLAREKKSGSYRASWEKIAAYKPPVESMEPVMVKPEPIKMIPMLRQGDRLVPLPKDRMAAPPPRDGELTVNPPADKRTGALLTNLVRGNKYMITYNAQNARKINIDRWYNPPFNPPPPPVFVDNVVSGLERDATARYEWSITSRFRPEYRCNLSIMDANNPLIYYINSAEFYVSASRTLDDVEPFLEYRAEAVSVECSNLDFLSKHGFPDLHFRSFEFYWEPFPGQRIFTDVPKELADILADNMEVDEFSFGGRGGVDLDMQAQGVISTVAQLGYGSWTNRPGVVFPPQNIDMLHDPQAQIYRSIVDRRRPCAMGWPGFPPEYTYSEAPLYGGSACLFGFAFHTDSANPDSRMFYLYIPSWDRSVFIVPYESQNGPADAVLHDYNELVPLDMVVKFPSEKNTTLTPGQQIKIKWGSWASQTGSDNVRIELFRNGARQHTIVSSTSNDGSFDWTVPSGQALGTGYKIRITSTSDSSIFDFSDGDFKLVQGRQVLQPTTGDTVFRKGETKSITWQGFTGTSVRIDLYRNSTKVLTISSSTPNDGFFAWVIPKGIATGSGYSITVAETSNTARYARSRGTFSILPVPKVLSPDLSQTLWMGRAYDIRWSGFTGSTVSIILYMGPSTPFTTLTASTANDGLYRWYIPLTLPIMNAKIKVVSRGTGRVPDSDLSDQVFGIRANELFLGSTQEGNISSSSDVDFYRFRLPIPVIASIITSSGLLTDSVMELYGPATPTTLIETDDDDAAQYMSRIDRPLLTPGQYYFVKVRPHSTDLRGDYRIQLTTRTAPQIFLDDTMFMRISNPGEVNWTTFTLPAVGNTIILATMDTLPAGKLTLFDSTGRQLVSVRSSLGNARIQRIMQPGLYYLKSESGINDRIGRYTLQVTQEQTAGRKKPVGTAPKQ